MSTQDKPFLLKGALIEFSERFISAVPNVIIFQFNPETMTRTVEAWKPPEKSDQPATGSKDTAATAQPGDPTESFSLVLELDAADVLDEPSTHPVAVMAGVADRVSAIELLMYPQEDSLLGGLLGSVAGSLGGVTASLGGSVGKPAERSAVPLVLFVWGPGRILPVRVTSFSVEEQTYSPMLYPLRAKVSLGLKVQQPDELDKLDDKKYKVAKEIGKFAYKFTKKQKEVLALANIANSVESILGMLPI